MIPLHAVEPGLAYELQGTVRFRASVNQITHGKQAVNGRIEFHGVEQVFQAVEHAMDIADSKIPSLGVFREYL
jgi:hypothetical protein